MKISVITVALNAAATLEQTLRSVREQGWPDVEHIVVDGGSADGSVEILRRNEESLSRWISEPDNGLYDAMNKGIAMAGGEIVGFLNADDVYAHNQVLSRVGEALSAPGLDGCYGDLVYVDAGNMSRIIRYWRSEPYREGLFERGWMPAHPTFFVRRTVYERYGDFRVDLEFQADLELTARFIAVNRISVAYLPEILVRMRIGGKTNRSVSNILKGNMESYRACRDLGLDITPLYFLRKFAMRVPQFFRRPPGDLQARQPPPGSVPGI